MTEQQRTARIEFVKKLLVANGFCLHKSTLWIKHTHRASGLLGVCITPNFVQVFQHNSEIFSIPHDQSLKPLRDFIKLSNQKQE